MGVNEKEKVYKRNAKKRKMEFVVSIDATSLGPQINVDNSASTCIGIPVAVGSQCC